MFAVVTVDAAAGISTSASRIELAGAAAAPVRLSSVAPPVAVPATTCSFASRAPVASIVELARTTRYTLSMRGFVASAAANVAIQSAALSEPETPELESAVILTRRSP
jgi:hypothetical protein